MRHINSTKVFLAWGLQIHCRANEKVRGVLLQKIQEVPFSSAIKSYLSWPSSMPPLKPIEVVPQSMWRIHVDILGPLPMSRHGNQYIALGVCALLKYVEAMRN